MPDDMGNNKINPCFYDSNMCRAHQLTTGRQFIIDDGLYSKWYFRVFSCITLCRLTFCFTQSIYLNNLIRKIMLISIKGEYFFSKGHWYLPKFKKLLKWKIKHNNPLRTLRISTLFLWDFGALAAFCSLHCTIFKKEKKQLMLCIFLIDAVYLKLTTFKLINK